MKKRDLEGRKMKKTTADLYQRKLDYNNAYNRENYRSFSVRYNNKKEKKIISWLEKQDSIKDYITALILADMEKNKTAKKKKTTVKKAAAPAKKTARPAAKKTAKSTAKASTKKSASRKKK
jgi:hypothetical protein